MKKKDAHFERLPDSPGVYFFKQGSDILYVGKATSLRDRVRSYFSADLAEVRSPLVAKIVEEATTLDWEVTDSVLDALILESKRIKQYRPPGNTDQKDDKSFAYLAVTKEKFPRFLIFRGRELKAKAPPRLKALYGPFMSAYSLREALKIIRRIFPFFDTPFVVSERMSPANAKTLRFNQAIGLYPDALDEKAYAKSVRNIMLLFDARKKTLLKTLERDMNRAAKDEHFEDAAELRRQLFALKHIQDVTLIKEELREPLSSTFRIEAYDTAHLHGTEPRGVMAVFEDGEPRVDEYRTFTIRAATPGDDFGALKEVIERRARHPEWPYPKLIVIDGGRTHLNAAKKALEAAGMGDIPAVSVVKDERHRPKQVLGPTSLIYPHESAILKANAEAHRFSLGRHRRAFRKRMQ